MNNKKCHYCGFINFVTAEECRKCEAALSASGEAPSYDHASTYRGGVSAYATPHPTRSGFSILKGFALVGVVLVVFATAWWGVGFIRGGAKISWIEYQPDGVPITLMVPNKPVRLEPVVTSIPGGGSISQHQFTATVPDQGSALFCFGEVSGRSLNSADMPRYSEATLQNLLQQLNAKLISKSSIEYQGMPGLEFEIKSLDDDERGYGKMFVSPTRMYVLIVAGNEGTELIAGKEKFLNPKITPTF
jgi:hypothetical protein